MAKKRNAKASNPKTNALNVVFEKSGFTHIASDEIHFTLHGLTSDIDHIFAYENILILCEKTTGASLTEHFAKKKDFHEKIFAHKIDFIKEHSKVNNQFAQHIQQNSYEPGEYEIRSVYYSENKSFSDGIVSNPGPFTLMSAEINSYFRELVQVISKSARYEILKFLKIEFSQLGEIRVSGQQTPSLKFQAFVLPGRHTNYPEDFILVSFYMDPKTLIEQAYVLRRDGWMNSAVSYQRFVKKRKLQQMRDYLAKEGKVFINNLIITLPNTVQVMHAETKKSLDATQIEKTQHVELSIPSELGTIGIVDGQHRVLAYHEGDDEFESRIARIRGRQNLLATGIIFPANYSAEDRVKFEAELFLKINNTQTGVSDALKQELETIINPQSPIAIAKLITTELARSGPLAGHVQTSIYDGTDKIKTASFSRYALMPLISPSSPTSLYTIWSEKKDLAAHAARTEYILFCQKIINLALAGMKINLNGRWGQQTRRDKSLVLTPTSIGGLFFYLKRMIESEIDVFTTDFTSTFQNVALFPFTDYGSSKWSQTGAALFEKFPPTKRLDPSAIS